MPAVDFSAANRDPLTQPKYRAVVTKAKFGLSKTSNQPKVDFEFLIKSDVVSEDSRKLFMSPSAQPNSLWKLKEIYVAMGIDPEALEASVDIDSINADVIGVEVMLEVSTGEYLGKPKDNIDSVKSISDF